MKFFCLVIGFVSIGLILGANKGNRAANDPSFIAEQKFSKAQCEVLATCKVCSFPEVKELKECLISGYVSVKKCTKVNSANAIDKFDYHVYEPCNTGGVSFKWVHLFLLDCFLILGFFLVWLNRHKTRLENQLFEKL